MTKKEQIDHIVFIRPILIILVTLTHLPFLMRGQTLTAETPFDLFHYLITFIFAILPKSSVPVLSLISGYLAFKSLERYGYTKLLYKKTKSLIIPMVIWNLIIILCSIYPSQHDFTMGIGNGGRSDLNIYPFDFMGWFQATFAFYRLPANPPLYFLKDLFTCFLLIPLLILITKNKYISYTFIAWLLYKVLYKDNVFILPFYPTYFFRIDILTCFFIGLFLASQKKGLSIPDKRLALLIILLWFITTSVVSYFFVIYQSKHHPNFFLLGYFLIKIAGVAGFLSLAQLVPVKSAIRQFFIKISPYSFTIFLSHIFSILVVHKYIITADPSKTLNSASLLLSGFTYVLLIIVFAITIYHLYYGLLNQYKKYSPKLIKTNK